MENQWDNSIEDPMNTTNPKRGFSIASLVLGIISLIIFAIIAGPLAIVFGVIAINQEGKNNLAIAGIITGAIGIISWIIIMALWF